MTQDLPIDATRLGEDGWLDLEQFARACGVQAAFVRLLVDEDLLAPAEPGPAWRFGSAELARARRIHRLQRDFDASLASVAVMLDLFDEVERLRAALRRAGIER